MPIELEDYYFSEKIQLVREYYADENYRAGIAEAVVLKRSLKSDEKAKYYCSLCKLSALGYRKISNWKSAFSVLLDADSYVKEMYGKTENDCWIIEHAVLKANIAAIHYSAGDYIKAMQFLEAAKTIFEEAKDYKHLLMVYESIAESQTASGDIAGAELTRNKIQALMEEQLIF